MAKLKKEQDTTASAQAVRRQDVTFSFSDKITAEKYNPATGRYEPLEIDSNKIWNAVISPAVEDKYSPKGRKLRKAFERPRPDLPADAPINRMKRQIALTLPPDLIDELNAATKDIGIDRNAFIERAVRHALKMK